MIVKAKVDDILGINQDFVHDNLNRITASQTGATRLAYAGLAKVASLMNGLTARETFEFRNSLKKIFRLNPFST